MSGAASPRLGSHSASNAPSGCMKHSNACPQLLVGEMRALLISADVKERIRLAVECARHQPVSLATIKAFTILDDKPTLTFRERPLGFARPQSEHVFIPEGFHAAISFEEQPAGLCRHLSISVDKAEALPSPPVVDLIAKAFGFKTPLLLRSRIWVEEYEPGRRAVNVVQLAEKA
jgi:hypothetical protein